MRPGFLLVDAETHAIKKGKKSYNPDGQITSDIRSDLNLSSPDVWTQSSDERNNVIIANSFVLSSIIIIIIIITLGT